MHELCGILKQASKLTMDKAQKISLQAILSLKEALSVIYLAGAGYLINSLAWFLFPHLATYLFPYVLLPAFIGETSMSFWLIFKGVKVQTER